MIVDRRPNCNLQFSFHYCSWTRLHPPLAADEVPDLAAVRCMQEEGRGVTESSPSRNFWHLRGNKNLSRLLFFGR